jgi:hypothetical protein
MEGLRRELFESLHHELPCLLVVYLKRERHFRCIRNFGSDVIYLSPFFLWITHLFHHKNAPPTSFMDVGWLRNLKKLLYNPIDHKPITPEADIPVFNVDMNRIQTYMRDNFEDDDWIFVYDDCRGLYPLIHSDVSNDECPLIVFLRVFLSNITKKEPFIDLANFENSILFLDLDLVSEIDMRKAVLAWLRGKDGIDLMLRNDDEDMLRAVGEGEVEEQESDDSKGKDDI